MIKMTISSSEFDRFHHHDLAFNDVFEPSFSESRQTRFVNKLIGFKDIVDFHWIMPGFDFGDLNGKVDTCCCSGDGFSPCGDTPSNLVTILLAVFVIFFS
jgi:hypothetical protein